MTRTSNVEWRNGQSRAPTTYVSLPLRKQLHEMLAPSLTAVKPLPSQRSLILAFLAVFAACAGALIAILSKAGFHLMTGVQMGLMATLFTGGGVLFSISLAQQMIPGSRPSCAVFGGGRTRGRAPNGRHRAAVSLAKICRFCFRGLALCSHGTHNRRPGYRHFLAACATRSAVRVRWTRRGLNRLGRVSRLDASSIPVHVPTSSTSIGLACWTGAALSRVRGARRAAGAEPGLSHRAGRIYRAGWNNAPRSHGHHEAVLDPMAADRGAQVKNLQVRLQPLFKIGLVRWWTTNLSATPIATNCKAV